MANGFSGKEGQAVPTMTDEFANSVSERYIELYERITGEEFVLSNRKHEQERIDLNINGFIKRHVIPNDTSNQ